MKLISLFLLVLLVACGKSEQEVAPQVAPQPEMGIEVGKFTPPGGGTMQIRTFTVEGTNCIWVGRYSSSSLSCNWPR
jgi:hypothetical protein